MSLNKIEESRGDYTYHSEQWCDGSDWVEFKGVVMGASSAFSHLVAKSGQINKLTEQNKMLREALIRVSEWDNMSQEFRLDNGSRGQQRVIVSIAEKALEATK